MSNKLREENSRLKNALKDQEEVNRAISNELDLVKQCEKSSKNAVKIELEGLARENAAIRENERQLLKLKNSLEIELQNLKVQNERLSFQSSKVKEPKSFMKNLTYLEEPKPADDSMEFAKPVRDMDYLKQSLAVQPKGIEKLNELDELIKSFKHRRLNTNKD